MKVTFHPAPGASFVEATLPVEQSPERITQRERVPDDAQMSVKLTTAALADTDPEIPVMPAIPPVETSNYRSVNRPAMAVLTVLDDGSRTDGEPWRIRTDRFVIGRTHGNCVIEIGRAHV